MVFLFLNKMFGGTWAIRERYRKSRSRIVRLLLEFIYSKALQLKGSWISLDSHFETIPLFPHGIYGVFISGGVSIGRNCVIFQHVTIGSNTLLDSPGFGAPTIGDNCYVGVGAKIIGKVTIGDNVRVGANAVVVRSVPDNALVISGEQRIVKRDHPMNNRFYHKNRGHWRYFDNGTWHQVEDVQELELLESRWLSTRQ